MVRPYWKVLISLAAVALAALAYLGTVDDLGRRYTEDGLKRALITFGIARGLNGVISVAQGTEVALEPAGIGIVLAPGEILDPVNDLIERFSWVMLASASSLGVQRILLNVTAWEWFTLAVVLCLGFALVLLWRPRSVTQTARRIAYRTAAVLLILRFAIPLIAILNQGFYSYFLEPQYDASRQRLEATAQEIGELNAESRPLPSDGEAVSLLESARRAYQSAADAVNIERRMESFKQAAADVSEHAINLIVVFSLQTILLPLLFLWLVVHLVKGVVGARFGN